jgi:hypothetical protein
MKEDRVDEAVTNRTVLVGFEVLTAAFTNIVIL